MGYKKIQVPAVGDKITVNADHSLNVPNNPIIPFIEGDGIGVDISPVMIKVVDAAVKKAYGGERKISWMEVYAGARRIWVSGSVKLTACACFYLTTCSKPSLSMNGPVL